MRRKISILVYLIAQLSSYCFADKPCKAVRFNETKSTVCVCTADYCDELTREEPTIGNYVVYTTTEEGLRFQKSIGTLEPYCFKPDPEACISDDCFPALYLDLNGPQLQTIEGFGGAVTDAAGINWLSMKNETLRQHLIDSYFSSRGIEYNMIRVPIGGSDFSTHAYAYNEKPQNDLTLSNYTLSAEDYELKLPMIKESMNAATSPVHVVATTWSPPGWMKDNNSLVGLSHLKKEYYQTYADYYLKFIQQYDNEGVPIWGITTTNEPTNAIIDTLVPFNSLGWTVSDLGRWIVDNLGPTIRNSQYKDLKILAMDDQRHLITSYFYSLARSNPNIMKYVNGVAVHFYFDSVVPPEIMSLAVQDFPDVFVIATEACAGANPNDFPKVDLGSWERAELYAGDIIQDLNYNLTGWIDWNLCLNEQGGPNWVGNYVDAPIIIADDNAKFYKQPMYYAMGHFSKFIPRGSKRIHVDSLCKNTVDHVAFLTQYDTVVTVLFNTGEATKVDLVTCNRIASLELDRKSITTVEFNYEPCVERQ